MYTTPITMITDLCREPGAISGALYVYIYRQNFKCQQRPQSHALCSISDVLGNDLQHNECCLYRYSSELHLGIFLHLSLSHSAKTLLHTYYGIICM